MKSTLNKIALKAFDIVASRKGFSFQRVITAKALQQIAGLCQESNDNNDETAAPRFQKGITRFVAYHRGTPVGVVSLADLSLTGRAYSSYAVDETGKFFEIQELVIRGQHEADDRFILLGLFRQMYSWSNARSITYWHCNGARDVYKALRLYSWEIEKINIDFESVRNPFNQFLVTKCIRDAWFGLEVGSLAPWSVLKKFMRVQAGNIACNLLPVPQSMRQRRPGWSMG